MPNENASDQAKARLAALEADPKHTAHPDPAALEQSRVDDLHDPKHNNGKDEIDPGWHEDADGNFTLSGFE
jgi:hypothetical protein